uniref:Uncharacterized protein LOC104239379 n=1 Tax=Nicotiana sylvestris TaxID=4096 RepID=A0A1U7XN31_NICSY|nr:PREDICTED: uncharacterized protein LOC104239379 [Nicotiana sylvestris]
MATTKKNALLLQRRLKKREATTNRLLGSIKSINLAESMCAIQDNVIVGGSCSISKRVSTDHEVFTPLNVLDKGKNVIHSISTFEKGSTSSTSGKSSGPNTETILVDAIPNLQNFHIALNCDAGLDQRVYNLPTTTDIAAIQVDENDSDATHTPHVQIYTHSDNTHKINYYFGCYDPLQYPLLFPFGQGGWHCSIKKFRHPENIPRNRTLFDSEQLPNINIFSSVDGYLDMETQNLEQGKCKRNVVSVREYYYYKLQMRNDDEDEILHTGRLFQQYSVDEYIKLETQRLDFVVFNQDLFRMSVLQGLLDVLRLGERDASNVGKQTFLPNSFIGGPRDIRQRYMDAIVLVQHFGKLDLFITMTCNSSWIEIEEHLSSSDEAQNRSDLISRVFRAKIEELKTDILKRNIFGKVVAFMYTVKKNEAYPMLIFLLF